MTIQKGGASWTGAPTWLIYDGFRNKFFRIDLTSFEILSRWKSIPLSEFCQSLSDDLGRPIDGQEIVDLTEFLFANSLTRTAANNSWRNYYDQARSAQKSWWQTVLHNYLFFRVPLARPQRFINACWPFVAPLFTRTSVFFFFLITLLGLYLVQRQWQGFVNTFLDFLTFEGLMVYAVSLVGIKIIHELGHAFMARKYGVDVPVIGVAFILLFPVLYTDTTGATRLSNKRDRLMIDLAGIQAELALAGLATVLWVFLPDGPLRSVAFTTATLSWIMSLGVNLNPFMRFDGYYVFSDVTGIENLQERGFALARWRLRELLFGVGHKAPEILPPNWRRLVILHAWGTWIYRFLLFLGIALIVYAFFVKVIGVFLFVIEILWFILLPIWRELSVWWRMRSEILSSRRSRITAACVVAFAAFLLVPWSSKVTVYATMQHKETATLYAPLAGKVVSHALEEGAVVAKGDILMQMESPDTEAEIQLTQQRVTLLKTRLSRANADNNGRSLYQVIHRELESERKALEGLQAQKDKLVIKAPLSGILSNVDRDIHEGAWLNSDYRLAIIRPDSQENHSGGEIILKGLVSQTDIARLSKGNSGHFIFDNGEYGSAPVKIVQINSVALDILPEPYLADEHGGQVPTTRSRSTNSLNNAESESLKPRGSWFSVDMLLEEGEESDQAPVNLTQIRPGTAIIKGQRKSIASKIATKIASVLIRESGI